MKILKNVYSKNTDPDSHYAPLGKPRVEPTDAAQNEPQPAAGIPAEPIAVEAETQEIDLGTITLTELNNFAALGSGHFGKVCKFPITNPQLLQTLKDKYLCPEGNIIAVKTFSATNATMEEIDDFIDEGLKGNILSDAYAKENLRYKQKHPGQDLSPFYNLSGLGKLTIVDDTVAPPTERTIPVILSRLEATRSDTYIDEVNQHHSVKDPLLIGNWLLQLTRGLKRMHLAGIQHRDLAPRNILLDRNHKALLCDYGLSSEMNEMGQAKIVDGNGPAPLRILDSIRLNRQPATPASDFYALRVTLMEFLMSSAGLNNKGLFYDSVAPVAVATQLMNGAPAATMQQWRMPVWEFEKSQMTIFCGELQNLIDYQLSQPLPDDKQNELIQTINYLSYFKDFLINDKADPQVSTNQRLYNLYLSLINGFKNLAETDPNFQATFDSAAKNDLAMSAFDYALREYRATGDADKFRANMGELLKLDVFNLDPTDPYHATIEACKTWSLSDAPTQENKDNVDRSIAALFAPPPIAPEQPAVTNDVINKDKEAYQVLDLAKIRKSVKISDFDFPVYTSTVIPETELPQLYEFITAKFDETDGKPANAVFNYPGESLKKFLVDFSNHQVKTDSLLSMFEKQLKWLQKDGLQVYNYNDQEFLVKFNESNKDLNPIHANEAEIQAIRYLRGMLYIAQNDVANAMVLRTHINVAYKKYLDSKETPANATHVLAEDFAKILKTNISISINDARKQVNAARDLGTALETHQPICTLSKSGDQITLEQADLIKLDAKFYDAHMSNVETQDWFKHVKKAAGINPQQENWLANFYNRNYDKLQAKGTPGVSSLRDARPGNLQKVTTYVAQLDANDKVETETLVSSSWNRLTTPVVANIHNGPVQLEIAKEQLIASIKSTLRDALQDFYNKYHEILPQDKAPDFFINYQSLLTPWLNENKIPDSIYDDNNGRFVEVAKKAMQEAMEDLRYANRKIVMQINDENGEPFDFKVQINYHQTNAAINRRTVFSTKNRFLNFLGITDVTNPLIATYKEDRESRLAKIAATEKILDVEPGKLKTITEEDLNKNLTFLRAGKRALDRKLQSELAVRLEASYYLNKLLENKPPYKNLSIYQRNIMMASLEFLAVGSQALAFTGCKSARDRTAIFDAAQKTMLENPIAMSDWNVLVAGITKSLQQGHPFRAMKFHSAVAKISAVSAYFFDQLKPGVKKQMTSLMRFSKKLSDPVSYIKKNNDKLLQIVDEAAAPINVEPAGRPVVAPGAPAPTPSHAAYAPTPPVPTKPSAYAPLPLGAAQPNPNPTPDIPKTEAKTAQDWKNSQHVLAEIYDTEKVFRTNMKDFVNFFWDATNNQLKPDAEFLAAKVNLTPSIRNKLEEFVLAYKTFSEMEKPLGEQDINNLLATFSDETKRQQILDPIKKIAGLQTQIAAILDYVPTLGGFRKGEGYPDPNSYYIQPIQRLMRYPLLLGVLEKNAPAATKAQINGVLNVVSAEVDSINKSNPMPEPSELSRLNQLINKKITAISNAKDELNKKINASKIKFLFRHQIAHVKVIETTLGELNSRSTYEDKLAYLKTAPKSEEFKSLSLLFTQAINEKKAYESKLNAQYNLKAGVHILTPEEKQKEDAGFTVILKQLDDTAGTLRQLNESLLRYGSLFAKSKVTTTPAATEPTLNAGITPTNPPGK